MRTIPLALALAGATAAAMPAQAQEDGFDVVTPAPAAPEWAFEGTVYAVAAAGAFDGVGTEPEALVGRVEAELRGSLLFDDQTEIGFGLMLAAERDHPRADPRGDATGLAIGAGAPTPPFRSIHLRYASEGAGADRGARAQLERASVFVRNPFGEVSLGRQLGVGAAFAQAVRYPSRDIAASDPRLDLTGLGAPIVIDRLSGGSAKLAVKTRRVLGVQLGLSYTPDIEAAGLDDPKRLAPPEVQGAKPERVLEAAAGFELNPPGTDFLLSASMAYSKAAGPRVGGLFDDVETVSGSFAFSGPAFSIGARALNGDNGWAGGGGSRGYSAAAGFVSFTQGEAEYGLEIATSSDNLVNSDTRAAVFSITAPIGQDQLGLKLSYGVQAIEREINLPGGSDRTDRSVGAFVQLSWASW